MLRDTAYAFESAIFRCKLNVQIISSRGRSSINQRVIAHCNDVIDVSLHESFIRSKDSGFFFFFFEPLTDENLA